MLLEASEMLSMRANSCGLPREDIAYFFRHLIGALFARWITLKIAKEQITGLTPGQWLWMQIDNAWLSTGCFQQCLALSTHSLWEILDLLRSEAKRPAGRSAAVPY